MTVSAGLLPNGKQQFIDIDGNPLVGGMVYFFIPGTTEPKTTWQDPDQSIPTTNPVILDSRGQSLIYGNGQYRQVVRDSLGNTIWDELTEWDVPASAIIITSGLVFCADGGGSAISTGVMRAGYCPFDATITGWVAQADQIGSVELDIWVNTFADDSQPTVSDTICAGLYPTLSSNLQIRSTTLTGWTTTIAANSAILINVRSASTLTKLTLTLPITRTVSI